MRTCSLDAIAHTFQTNMASAEFAKKMAAAGATKKVPQTLVDVRVAGVPGALAPRLDRAHVVIVAVAVASIVTAALIVGGVGKAVSLKAAGECLFHRLIDVSPKEELGQKKWPSVGKSRSQALKQAHKDFTYVLNKIKILVNHWEEAQDDLENIRRCVSFLLRLTGFLYRLRSSNVRSF